MKRNIEKEMRNYHDNKIAQEYADEYQHVLDNLRERLKQHRAKLSEKKKKQLIDDVKEEVRKEREKWS